MQKTPPEREFRGMASAGRGFDALPEGNATLTTWPHKKISKIFSHNPKVHQNRTVKGRQLVIRRRKNCSEANMTSNEVLAMYENIASLTSRMASAAKAGDWNGLDKLENQCAAQASKAIGGVPALQGAERLRKIDLLKQILANDRAIREETDPWMGQLDRAMCAH
jgi:flagellar protein FliT